MRKRIRDLVFTLPDGNNPSLIYCKHSDISHLRIDQTFHICSSINQVYTNQAEAYDNTRSSLLQDGYLLIDESRIALYGDNRFLGATREDTERVLIKDLTVWGSDGLINNNIKTQSQLKTNGIVYRSKARNNITPTSSPFFIRDRYLYAKRGIDLPLPDTIKGSRHVVCERCHKNDHKSTDLEKCDAYIASQPDLRDFTRGTFSNFDMCDVTMDGRTFPTSEHCYQWSAATEAKNLWDAKRLGASIKKSAPKLE